MKARLAGDTGQSKQGLQMTLILPWTILFTRLIPPVFFFFFCAHRYHRANAVRYHSGSACPGLCMLNHYCAITRLDYDEFRICLEKEQLALQGRAPAALMPTSWSWLLGVLAVFYGLHAERWSGGCNNCHIQRI